MQDYQPSAAKKVAQIAFAVFFCLTCSGVIFGFAALKPVLAQEGVYAEYCPDRHRNEDGSWAFCEEQDTRLNMIFTFATFATNGAALPIGYTLDTIGPRKTSTIDAVIFLLGNLLFGLGYRSSWMDTYFAGYILLAIGGPLIFLSCFHLSNTFPAYSGVILSAVTGAFDASSIPYVIYAEIYKKTHLHLRGFFWAYTLFPVIVIIEQLLLAPPVTYQRTAAVPAAPVGGAPSEAAPETADEEHGDPHALSSSFSRVHYGELHDNNEDYAKTEGGKDPLTGMLYDKSAKQQILSKWFWVLTVFTCIHMARINFYILSVFAQIEYFTGSLETARLITTTFTILLPLGGIAGIPLVGILLDTRPYRDVVVVMFGMGLLFGLLGITTAIWSQIVGIVFFVLFRPLLYTAVSDGFAKIVGFTTFGTVYGLCMTMSGLFGLINAPLDVFVKSTLHNDFLPVDIGLMLAGALCAAIMYGLVWHGTRQRAVQLQ